MSENGSRPCPPAMRRLKRQQRWQRQASLTVVIAGACIKTIAERHDPIMGGLIGMFAFNLIGLGAVALTVLAVHQGVVLVWNKVVDRRSGSWPELPRKSG